MSETQSEGEAKVSIEEEPKSDRDEPAPSDEEDDYEGYFLEPVAGNVNISEKIAEANKKLFEEEEDDENRPRKVQFSEDLVNFLPDYYSDDEYTESLRNSVISEEDSELKLGQEPRDEDSTEIPAQVASLEMKEEENFEEIAEEIMTDLVIDSEEVTATDSNEGNHKLLLVLLPKEQNSSCESIIGEEIAEEKKAGIEEKESRGAPEKLSVKTRIARPKSAKKSCEVSKISPNLSCSSDMERKSWQTRNSLSKSKIKTEGNEKKCSAVGETRVEIKKRSVKKINIGELNLEEVRKENLRRCCENRPKSSLDGKRDALGVDRPMTAPMKRTCCVIKTELPRYNGLRSEYGLSAEQLQERKRKTIEIKQQKKQEKLQERQEELRRKRENEETFRRWLLTKTKKCLNRKPVKVTDTLTRSDVYIQTHAAYAANRSVPYSVDYNLGKKINYKKRETWERKNKTIILDKLLDKVSPHFKRSFNIYLGIKP